MRRLFPALSAVALAACATMPPAGDAVPALERAFAAYQRIRAAAAIARPLLSPELQATIDAAEARANVAFALARAAAGAAERASRLREAEAAARVIAATAR